VTVFPPNATVSKPMSSSAGTSKIFPNEKKRLGQKWFRSIDLPLKGSSVRWFFTILIYLGSKVRILTTFLILVRISRDRAVFRAFFRSSAYSPNVLNEFSM
jgi:hypothetical protein